MRLRKEIRIGMKKHRTGGWAGLAIAFAVFAACWGVGTAAILAEEELKLYTKEYGDGRKEYRYGPEWVSWELFMEGGYATPEEAKAA